MRIHSGAGRLSMIVVRAAPEHAFNSFIARDFHGEHSQLGHGDGFYSSAGMDPCGFLKVVMPPLCLLLACKVGLGRHGCRRSPNSLHLVACGPVRSPGCGQADACSAPVPGRGGSTRACPNRPRHGIIIVVPSALLRLGRPKGWLERQRRLQEPVWRAPRAGNTAPSLVWSWWHGSPVPAQHSWWWLFENRRASCNHRCPCLLEMPLLAKAWRGYWTACTPEVVETFVGRHISGGKKTQRHN
ncbi:unnamed protein product [Prorocentrum cordatum]|uniref:Uncharacterized protein n=1 Tax=Prorocentrum cordatum TaxID=2364126 RepID=A0ABN9YAL5_9DINO|nr:unnamed protein product [Polarella glacialis]